MTHGKFLDLESYLKSRNRIDCLELFLIPASEAAIALTDLDLMNINFATLYPDLDGTAKQVNMKSAMETLRATTQISYQIPGGGSG